jgi:hypothetical protein
MRDDEIKPAHARASKRRKTVDECDETEAALLALENSRAEGIARCERIVHALSPCVLDRVCAALVRRARADLSFSSTAWTTYVDPTSELASDISELTGISTERLFSWDYIKDSVVVDRSSRARPADFVPWRLIEHLLEHALHKCRDDNGAEVLTCGTSDDADDADAFHIEWRRET